MSLAAALRSKAAEVESSAQNKRPRSKPSSSKYILKPQHHHQQQQQSVIVAPSIEAFLDQVRVQEEIDGLFGDDGGAGPEETTSPTSDDAPNQRGGGSSSPSSSTTNRKKGTVRRKIGTTPRRSAKSTPPPTNASGVSVARSLVQGNRVPVGQQPTAAAQPSRGSNECSTSRNRAASEREPPAPPSLNTVSHREPSLDLFDDLAPMEVETEQSSQLVARGAKRPRSESHESDNDDDDAEPQKRRRPPVLSSGEHIIDRPARSLTRLPPIPLKALSAVGQKLSLNWGDDDDSEKRRKEIFSSPTSHPSPKQQNNGNATMPVAFWKLSMPKLNKHKLMKRHISEAVMAITKELGSTDEPLESCDVVIIATRLTSATATTAQIEGICLCKALDSAFRITAPTPVVATDGTTSTTSLSQVEAENLLVSSSNSLGEMKSFVTLCGVQLIWVRPDARRQRLAMKLVDCARHNVLYGGQIVERADVAFSQPSMDGKLFAWKYTGLSDFYTFL